MVKVLFAVARELQPSIIFIGKTNSLLLFWRNEKLSSIQVKNTLT